VVALSCVKSSQFCVSCAKQFSAIFLLSTNNSTRSRKMKRKPTFFRSYPSNSMTLKNRIQRLFLRRTPTQMKLNEETNEEPSFNYKFPITKPTPSTDTMSSLQFAKLCNISVLPEDEEDELSTTSTMSFRERPESPLLNATSNQATASSSFSSVRRRRGSVIGLDWSFPFPTTQSPPPIMFPVQSDVESVELRGRFTVTRRRSVPYNVYVPGRRFSLVENSLAPPPLIQSLSHSAEGTISPLSN
jgi:hypothetical protein